ncbi:MAG: hypothetical protein ACQETE_09995 [Bacteroidota bacterium]
MTTRSNAPLPLNEQILQTWQIHHRSYMFMMDHIPEEAFSCTLSTHGGRDIARQLAHVHNNRVTRLSAYANRNGLEISKFDTKYSPTKQELIDTLNHSGSMMGDYIKEGLDNEGVMSNFKRGLIPMIGYYISHEAHHRGHLLLTMKQSGYSLPYELKFGLWEWNKI